MANHGISMASNGVSSCITRGNYDVFLSFRGTDTRKNFTDHLYTALVQAGYRTFRDDDEIERGNKIDSELRKAIEQSKISIIIFSKNYASSRWCLTELTKIVEYRQTSKHEILPIFYDVTPSQVRKQTESYREAFDSHEKKFSLENKGNGTGPKDVVERWRAALREVADLAGMELKNEADGHESRFVQRILKMVRNKLKRAAPIVVPYPVGTDSKVRGISSWIDTSTENILVIYGIEGIGKSTIAKIVFNKNTEKFEGGCFLADISKSLDGPSDLIQLQKQLLSDIAHEKEAKVHSVDEGFSKITRIVSHMKVLIILDDVNSVDHFNALVGNGNWVCPGSKIIVTTSNEHLGENRKVDMHKVDKLQDDDSLRLFCSRAFRKDYPAEGYKELAYDMARHCEGVPLALEILGSSLFGNTLDEWKKKLKKLKNIPNCQTLDILKVSFDSLPKNHDKRLFLDIASFFVGKDKDSSAEELEICGFFPVPGIENLMDRCLIKIDQDNKLVMHHLVREMAREIIREESSDPGKLGRVWPHNDVLILLRKCIPIFSAIILFFLFIMAGPYILMAISNYAFPIFERHNQVGPIFNKGEDSLPCSTAISLTKGRTVGNLKISNEGEVIWKCRKLL